MNLDGLRTKLIAAAKNNPPAENVPYLFEKRVMANLRSHSPLNIWALWGQPMWRAAISCVAITLLCGVWSLSNISAADSNDFSQDFESAVFAGMSQHVEDAW
jgi:hypothetical protein